MPRDQTNSHSQNAQSHHTQNEGHDIAHGAEGNSTINRSNKGAALPEQERGSGIQNLQGVSASGGNAQNRNQQHQQGHRKNKGSVDSIGSAGSLDRDQ